MASILKISDGTTTVDFLASNQIYRVAEWTPDVARPRVGELGGRGPYEDAIETMVISIKDSTPLGDLATVQYLMDQAARWAKGEPVAAVLLHYKPTVGSEELKAVITGQDGDTPMVSLPPNFVYAAQTGMLDGVVLRFRRAGLWLGEESTYDSGSASTMFAVKTVGVPTLSPIGYPVKLRLEGVGAWTDNLYNSFLCLSTAPTSDVSETRIKLLGATVFNSSTDGFSSQSDASNKPANGSTVLRYTPASTVLNYSDTWTATTTSSTARRWGVFVSYRNNHASTSFKFQFTFYGSSGVYRTPFLTVPGGVSNPQFAYVGAVSLNGPIDMVLMEIAASAAAGSIDIDVVALVALDSARKSRIVAVTTSGESSNLSGDDFIIDHRLLSHLSPSVYFDETADKLMPYRGDATIFLSDVLVYCTCLVCGGTRNPTHWRPNNSGTVFTNKWYITGRTAYLIPK